MTTFIDELTAATDRDTLTNRQVSKEPAKHTHPKRRKTDTSIDYINLGYANYTEQFAVTDSLAAMPGSLMVMNSSGLLEPCSSAYDKRVIGVVSGAGNRLRNNQRTTDNPKRSMAIAGKVTCLAIAHNQPIEIGDMLTTSAIMGHAMKATDREKSFGTIVGKALSPLDKGFGIIQILITLQ